MSDIIEALRRRRAALGMTQQALADVMDIGQPYVVALEHRTELPRVTTLRKWADALGYDVDVRLVDRLGRS